MRCMVILKMEMLENTMKRACLLLMFFTLFAAPATAQQLTASGFAQRPHRMSGNVDLVSEDVQFRLSTIASEVVCVYELHNTSEYNEYLRVGLPTSAPDDYMDFALFIDGDVFPFLTRIVDELVIKDGGEYEYSEYVPVNWLLWDIKFVPGQHREMVLRYSIPAKKQRLQNNESLKAALQAEFHGTDKGLPAAVENTLHDLDVNIIGYSVLPKSNWKLVQEGAKVSYIRVTAAGEENISWNESGGSNAYEVALRYVPGRSFDEILEHLQRALQEFPDSLTLKEIANNFKKMQSPSVSVLND